MFFLQPVRLFIAFVGVFLSVQLGQHIAVTSSKRAIERKPSGINAGISNNCMSLKPLEVEVINNIKGSRPFVYITGIDQVGATMFLTRSGTWFYPVVAEDAGSSSIDQALISIPIAEQTNVFTLTIQDCVVSGRIWISLGQLPFRVAASDSGSPYLVPPSVLDSTNTSNTVDWGFVELTYTDRDGLYANLSFVDFVGLILSLTLTLEQGDVQKVVGLASDGVYSVCEQLRQQSRMDGLPWDQLCVTAPSGRPLRVLSPNLFESAHPGAMQGYYAPYVNQTWSKYTSRDLVIDTQSSMGSVTCRVGQDGLLSCGGDNRGYARPSASDIWSCSTGPFAILADDNAVHRSVVPRLCAAFTRSTLLIEGGETQPAVDRKRYYPGKITNHYSRAVHQCQLDGKGYSFPYDDVSPAPDNVAGVVAGKDPRLLQIFVGGQGVA